MSPVFIAIGGMVGTGKTTLAEALLPEIAGAILVDADLERKKLFGVDPYQKLPDEVYTHENILRFIEHMQVIQTEALQKHPVVLSTGTWLTARARQGAEEICAKTGARMVGLWLEAPLATLFNRVTIRSAAPSISDAGVDVLEKLSSRPPDSPQQEEKWHQLDAEKSIEALKKEAQAIIAQATAQPRPASAAVKKLQR